MLGGLGQDSALGSDREMGWARGAIFGLGFFAIDLVPVLGFVPMSYRGYPGGRPLRVPADARTDRPGHRGCRFIADRLNGARLGALLPLAAAGAVLLGSLGISSRGYAAIFGNAAAYWTYSLEKNPGDWLARQQIRLVLLDANRVPEAMGEFEAALQIGRTMPKRT